MSAGDLATIALVAVVGTVTITFLTGFLERTYEIFKKRRADKRHK